MCHWTVIKLCKNHLALLYMHSPGLKTDFESQILKCTIFGMFPSFQLAKLNKLFFPVDTFIKENTTIANLHSN